MKVIIDVKDNQELKEVESFLKKKNIRIVEVRQELLDRIEDLSWEMGERKINSREEIYNR